MPRSNSSDEYIERLLGDAAEAFPKSDFVRSVRTWYEANGFITEAQEHGLENIVNSRYK